MIRIARLFVPFLIVLVLSCGGGTLAQRRLASLTISPTSATASGGNVQFIVTGTFNTAPMTVTPLTVIWTADRPAFSGPPTSNRATVDSNGLAHCSSGFTGVSQIVATAAVDPSQATSLQNEMVVSAQLTCP
ncbi:MAG TPA: hypothetical protein VKL99_16820 [Candidatus Angelobacter sp.]|nr:hypothetical protein [Candidatus Angelobacter sp.]